MTSIATLDSSSGREGSFDAEPQLSGHNVRCLITTEKLSPRSATVRIVGALNASEAFVVEQIVHGHQCQGRSLVCLDLTAVTDAEPAALRTLSALNGDVADSGAPAKR